MTSTTKPAPKSVTLAEIALRVEERLHAAKALLDQSVDDASDLAELLIEHQPFLRFNHALINSSDALMKAIYDVDLNEQSKQVRELLELMEYANRKDG